MDELMEIINNASTNLLSFEMVKMIIKGYKEKKISKKIAFDYISRVANYDASWVNEEDAKNLSKRKPKIK